MKFLLSTHILCGFIALMSAFGAIMSAKGQAKHRFCGRLFFYGMTGIFLTAIPLSIVKNNLFLFLIALFSYYLAFSGWRYAKNKTTLLDYFIGLAMVLVSSVMLALGIHLLRLQNTQGSVLLVFGFIGGLIALSDLNSYRKPTRARKERIAHHLTAMLGATIAALTAFSVTNIPIKPTILLWLGPTVLIVPIIIWWKYRLQSTKY